MGQTVGNPETQESLHLHPVPKPDMSATLQALSTVQEKSVCQKKNTCNFATKVISAARQMAWKQVGVFLPVGEPRLFAGLESSLAGAPTNPTFHS